LSLRFPATVERESHGTPCFFVQDKKTFAMFADNVHDDGRLAIWIAAPPGAQEALIMADPLQFFRPPYVGVRGWIGVRLDKEPHWDRVAALIEDAYRTVAPARLVREFDAAAQPLSRRGAASNKST
jgi:hypothetical protein